MTHRQPRHIFRDESGTTIIEFAVVSPLFVLLIMAVLEYGLYTFTQMALEMAVGEAGRNVSISGGKPGCGGGGIDRVAAFETDVRQKTNGLINAANLVISSNTVAAGGATVTPDICIIGGVASTPDCCPSTATFVDNNGNGIYDSPLGASGDEVELHVTLPWNVQFPFMKDLFGSDGVINITSSTIIRNE